MWLWDYQSLYIQKNANKTNPASKKEKTKNSGHVVVAASAPMPLVAIHSISCKGWVHFFVYAANPESSHSPQTQYVYVGETAQLNCSTQPGRARSLYRAEWTRNSTHLSNIPNTNFSLSVPVQDVSQNATVYQCTVIVQSCSPVSHISGCTTTEQSAVGDSITLVVGGECTLYCKSKLSNIGILGTLLQGNCDPKWLQVTKSFLNENKRM